MKVARQVVARAVARRADKDVSAKRLAQEIAAYLLSQNRSGELESLMRDVQQQRADRGIVEASVQSAYPLSKEAQADIKVRIKKMYPGAKKIILDQATIPEVVGGVRIILANERLDLSLRAKLNKLKQLTVA